MRVTLFALGAVFATAAVALVAYLLAGELTPYLGYTWIHRSVSAVAYIGTPVAISLVFFRWAWNMGRGYDR
jgi:hypothetical protein